MQSVIDWETRSPVDLKTQGVFVYAEHPDTEIMQLSIATGTAKPVIWVPDKFCRLINPDNIRFDMIDESEAVERVMDSDILIGHNTMFEYVIWRKIAHERLGWPPLQLKKLHDTMAQCAYHALPLNLDQAVKALNLPVQKDTEGHKIMLKLCKPRKPRKAEREADPDWMLKHWWHEDPKDLEALFNYGGQDTEAERALYFSLPRLPEYERRIWLLDQKINLRGVPVDLENVKAIVSLTAERETHQLRRFQDLTGGAVSGPRSYVALKNWVNEQTGLSVASVDKNATEDILKRKDITSTVREVLGIKSELSKSSVAKFKAIISRVNPDGRIRGMFSYFGASTGRWAARGVQLHNLPRDSYKPMDYETVAEMFRNGDTEAMSILYDDPFFVASRCIRGSLCTGPETEFICADFSSIEARGLAWLAGEEEVLEAFRKGLDLYKVAAAEIFGCRYEDVTDKQRQVGKCAVLALGFGGGIGAFASMAFVYKVDLETLPAFIMPYATPEELDGPYGARALAKAYVTKNPDSMSFEAATACDVIKRKWRASRPKTVQFWRGLEEAAYKAVEDPGQIYTYGKISYCYHDRFLKCQLPSGRLMHYYQPRIKPVKTNWDEEKLSITYMGLKVVDGKTTRQWTRLPTYGGKLAENVTQGMCRDFLAEGMLRLDSQGSDVCLHVHDEPAAEIKKGTGDLAQFEKLLSIVPAWAPGMPISAEGWIGRRYRK